MTIVEFLLARIGEDEEVARAATGLHWQAGREWAGYRGDDYEVDQIGSDAGTVVSDAQFDEADGAHIARHDPARVLAECEAKRRIVRQADGWLEDVDETRSAQMAHAIYTSTLSTLAAVYADHPDYDEEWATA